MRGLSAKGAETRRLAEVWGDVVDLRQLAAAVVIGGALSLATYLLAARIFAAVVASPDMARAYAMLCGLVACVVGGAICAGLFAPKRIIVEQDADWREGALQQLAADGVVIGRIEDLPPSAVDELKELGLYELFAASRATTGEQLASALGSPREPALVSAGR